jgi:hypothetical protein
MTNPTPTPDPAPVSALTGFEAFITALKGGGWVSLITALVTIATTYGLLSGIQANALETAAAAVASVLSAAVAVLHNFQGAKAVKAAALK